MVALSREQIEDIRRAQLEDFAEDAEAFLRRHFEPRLRPCSSADVRDAVRLACSIGRERDLTRRGEVLIYLACASVCGVFLFEDPRCVWLFDEEPTPGDIKLINNFDIRTFAHNLGAPPTSRFFDDDPLTGFEDVVRAAERRLAGDGSDAGIARALAAMTPAREELVESPYFARFLSAAREAGEGQRLSARGLTRYTLMAWLFGVRFVDDPLCRPVVSFLRAAE